ncbi:MAG: metallophosphoesterase family protein [Saprospiraceae bacterium]|nr:metallophosphoesterase family protein [Saprospiraceae bacterium]
MKRIGLLSDTHSFLDEKIFDYFAECNEIWHAGDIGSIEIADRLEAFKPFRAVYGNIDGGEIRQRYPLDLQFNCEEVNVFMTHIGGYPGKYNNRVKNIIKTTAPKLYICGHSHILKVISDKEFGLLHINPGSCGNEGFHKIKTIVRFTLDAGSIKDLEVIELGRRGDMSPPFESSDDFEVTR